MAAREADDGGERVPFGAASGSIAGPGADPGTEAEPASSDAGRAQEAALVHAALRHDAGAWARLCHDNFSALFRHVGFLVADPDVAQDVAQETFARALVSLDKFDGRARFLTWLKGIAHNVVYKHWRATDRRRRALERLERMAATVGELASSPEAEHVTRRRAEVLLLVLEALPPHLREAFVLCDLQRLPIAEAAEILGIAPGNAKVRAHRARARVKRRLEELGWLPIGEAS